MLFYRNYALLLIMWFIGKSVDCTLCINNEPPVTCNNNMLLAKFSDCFIILCYP